MFIWTSPYCFAHDIMQPLFLNCMLNFTFTNELKK